VGSRFISTRLADQASAAPRRPIDGISARLRTTLTVSATTLLAKLRALRPPIRSSMSIGPAEEAYRNATPTIDSTIAPPSNPEPKISTRAGEKMATVR
jgi:hypothetical protein